MSRRAFALALLLLVPGLAPIAARAQEARGLDIYFIDVMGGAATLVVTPAGESILVDSGWPGQEDRDPKRIVHVLKEVAGRDHLDHLVTTHWHVDHYGGVAGLEKLVRIDHFWDRGLPDPDAPGGDAERFPDGPKADDPLLKAYLSASEGKRATLKAGDTLPLEGEVTALVLASGGEVIPVDRRYPTGSAPANPLCDGAPPDRPRDDSDNARSITLLFRLGDFAFLDCGDLTWNIERKLVCPVDLIGPVDAFQVTHHGLDISNNPVLLNTIRPRVAVMNNGPRKGGSPATVARLRSIPDLEAFYQLHRNAATAPEQNTDPAHIANADASGGQFLHLSVSPDGARYTVRIGEDGQPAPFTTRADSAP